MTGALEDWHLWLDWLERAVGLNEYTPPARDEWTSASAGKETTADQPGHDFNLRGTWEETGLFAAGWHWHRQFGPDKGIVTRPGKGSGPSGTVGVVTSKKNNWPFFYSFSTSDTLFETDKPYSRFAVYATLNHNGNFREAAKALAARGYGRKADDPTAIIGDYEPEYPPPPITKLDGIECWAHDDLLNASFGPIRYVIDGIVADQSVTILGGVQKGGKSWLGIQAATAVAAGTDMLGKKVMQGTVVYLALEDGARRLQDRMWKQGTPQGLPIYWITKFQKLDSPEGWRKLIDVAASKPRLLIIDTLAAAKSGKTDETDSGPMADLFNGLRELAQRYEIAILVVHHHGKSVHGDPAHDLRGSSAIGAAADVLLGLYRVRRRADGETASSKDEHDPDNEGAPDFYLKARGRDIEDSTLAISFGANTDWRWSLAEHGTHHKQKVTAVMGKNGVTDVLKRMGPLTPEQIASEIKQSKRTVYRKLQDLREEGMIDFRTETVNGKEVTVYFHVG